MADTRYVEQTVFDLKRALDDLVSLGLLPAEAARAVVEIVTIRMKWRMGGTQEVEHGTTHTARVPETPLRLRGRVASLP